MCERLGLWGRTNLEELASRQLSPVRVAVVDTGIDSSHPDLAGRVEAAYRLDDAGGGFLAPSLRPQENGDALGHGTAVASVITRLASNASLVDIRVFNTGLTIPAAHVLAGLRLALDLKVHIVNLSLALKASYAPDLWTICEQAYRQHQIVVAARRNIPLLEDGFPAELSSCIGVDCERLHLAYAIRYRPDEIIEFAAHGEEVQVAAPGGGHTIKTGTSFAAPAVAAFCSLLLGRFPDLRLFELKTILKDFSQRDARLHNVENTV